MRLAWLAVLALAACTKQNEHVCVNGNCPSSDFPFCDVGGEVGGFPGLCIAADCTPGEFAACRSDGAITCNAAGDNYDVVACEHGCTAASSGCTACVPDSIGCSGNDLIRCDANGRAELEECQAGCVDGEAAHCGYLEPKYLPDICDAPALSDELIISNLIDVSNDLACNGGIIDQGTDLAPDICVIRYKRIIIQAGVNIRITFGTGGNVGRAVAFVADESLAVDGVLDVGARGNTSGPGGGYAFSGPGSTAVAPNGAGGAGFQTAGASGGSTTLDGGANDAGPAELDPALSSVFVGGPRSTFGGGGGAVMLIACRGDVSISGSVTAGGGGGFGGQLIFGTLIGGAGGGAGGLIVLQGLGIDVTGGVYANGGGGGAGKPSNLASGRSGIDGDATLTPAPGGGPTQSGEGTGGAGGVGGAPAGVGKKSTLSGATPGGGGGSIGFLQTYTPTGVLPQLTPAEVSPAFSANRQVRTR